MTLRESHGPMLIEQPSEPRHGRLLGSNVEPLSEDELSRAGYAAGRLFATLREAINAVPSTERSVRAMARFLNVDQNVPQRVIRAMQGGDASIQLLTRLPGCTTLRRFVEAVGQKTGGRFNTDAAMAGIAQFEILVRELAGNQIRLTARIRAGADPHQASMRDPLLAERMRRKMFEGAVDLTRVCMDAQVSLCVLGRNSLHENILEMAAVSATIGLELGPGAIPIVAGATLLEGTDRKVLADSELRNFNQDFSAVTSSNALIPEFCSKPLPKLVMERRQRSLLEIIEPPEGLSGKFDVALGSRVTSLPNPINTEQPHVSLGTRGRLPARKLVYTAYLHESLAAVCRPSQASHFWTPQSAANPLEVWYNRLPPHGALELLGSGLEQAATPTWGRMAELTSFVFQRLGWPPNEFVGYRFTVTYPYWGVGYNLLLDFGNREKEEEGEHS